MSIASFGVWPSATVAGGLPNLARPGGLSPSSSGPAKLTHTEPDGDIAVRITEPLDTTGESVENGIAYIPAGKLPIIDAKVTGYGADEASVLTIYPDDEHAIILNRVLPTGVMTTRVNSQDGNWPKELDKYFKRTDPVEKTVLCLTAKMLRDLATIAESLTKYTPSITLYIPENGSQGYVNQMMHADLPHGAVAVLMPCNPNR